MRITCKALLKYKTNAGLFLLLYHHFKGMSPEKVYQDQLIDLHLKGVLKLPLSIHTQYSPLHDVIYDVLHEIRREKTFGTRVLKSFRFVILNIYID